MLLMGKSTISMAIFNSYVKLPEGKWWIFHQTMFDYRMVLLGGTLARVAFAQQFVVKDTKGCVCVWEQKHGM